MNKISGKVSYWFIFFVLGLGLVFSWTTTFFKHNETFIQTQAQALQAFYGAEAALAAVRAQSYALWLNYGDDSFQHLLLSDWPPSSFKPRNCTYELIKPKIFPGKGYEITVKATRKKSQCKIKERVFFPITKDNGRAIIIEKEPTEKNLALWTLSENTSGNLMVFSSSREAMHKVFINGGFNVAGNIFWQPTPDNNETLQLATEDIIELFSLAAISEKQPSWQSYYNVNTAAGEDLYSDEEPNSILPKIRELCISKKEKNKRSKNINYFSSLAELCSVAQAGPLEGFNIVEIHIEELMGLCENIYLTTDTDLPLANDNPLNVLRKHNLVEPCLGNTEGEPGLVEFRLNELQVNGGLCFYLFPEFKNEQGEIEVLPENYTLHIRCPLKINPCSETDLQLYIKLIQEQFPTLPWSDLDFYLPENIPNQTNDSSLPPSGYQPLRIKRTYNNKTVEQVLPSLVMVNCGLSLEGEVNLCGLVYAREGLCLWPRQGVLQYFNGLLLIFKQLNFMLDNDSGFVAINCNDRVIKSYPRLVARHPKRIFWEEVFFEQ